MNWGESRFMVAAFGVTERANIFKALQILGASQANIVGTPVFSDALEISMSSGQIDLALFYSDCLKTPNSSKAGSMQRFKQANPQTTVLAVSPDGDEASMRAVGVDYFIAGNACRPAELSRALKTLSL